MKAICQLALCGGGFLLRFNCGLGNGETPCISFLFLVLRCWSPSPSVQIIGVFGDVISETERMVAHQCLGAARVARFQRFDDMHVIAN
jgi:hypothetical protein